jgi:UDP-galactopyranose mutase
MKKKALIIGGGFTGCTAAFELSKISGWDVTLIEKAPYLGAGNRTQYYKGHPYTFGPRHFLTRDYSLYSYLNKYVPLRSCGDHQFLTLGLNNNDFYNYPINFSDIEKQPLAVKALEELSSIFISSVNSSGSDPSYWDYHLFNGAKNAKNFEEFWINSIGKTLYDEFINDYSKKMWMIDDNKEIDDFTWSPKGVTIKKGGPECWSDAISGYPVAVNGYDDFFRISTENVNVLLNADSSTVNLEKKSFSIDGITKKFDVVINTVALDGLMNYQYGTLPFIGRDLLKILFPVENVLPPSVYFLYYADQSPFTRIVEYKKFTQHKSKNTLITLEIPSKNNKHYPLPQQKFINIHNQYKKDLPQNVFSIGRAGAYMYNVDIDDAIDHALLTVKSIIE